MSTSLDAAGLAELAKSLGIDIPSGRAALLLAYLDAMLEINQQINLTAVRERAAAVVLHALDGLAFGLTGLRPQHVLDLGTGNGFPGVCVACLHPGASVVLMDKTGKKVRAIGSCLMMARFDAVETVQLDAAQAPSLRPDYRHAFDVVTARAVGTPEAMAALAAPLLRPGGHLVLWLDADAEAPVSLMGFRRVNVLRYQLPEPAARERQLGIWQRQR